MPPTEKLISTLREMQLSKLREKFATCSVNLLKSLKEEFDRRYYVTGEDSIDDIRYDILV